MRQQVLPLANRDKSSFETFVAGSNAELVAQLRAISHGDDENQLIYFWSENATGKTHLLHAFSYAMTQRGLAVGYLPMQELLHKSLESLEGLEHLAAVCIDDLHLVSQSAAWEEGIFGLFNRMRDAGKPFIASANCAASQLKFTWPDLTSRLQWGLSYQVNELGNEGKLLALQSHAEFRGVSLPLTVARFLVEQYPSDMHALFEAFSLLCDEALIQKKRLTLPLVQKVLQQA